MISICADFPDHLRCQPNTTRGSSSTPKSDLGASESVCNGPTTDPNPAMRVFGDFGNTNDRMEGCYANGDFDIGQRRREPRLHPRFSESSSRRSHRRTKDQFDCMWAEKHHPPSSTRTLGGKGNTCIKI
jgi:hypothetical protein